MTSMVNKVNSVRTLTNQRGATLAMSLIILLVITLIGLAGIKTSLMQEKMAANAQNSNRTFQAAESAVGALVSELSAGNQIALTQAMSAPDSFSTATSYSIGDANVDASYQARYLGEIVLTHGSSIDSDESTTTLQGFRFELVGSATIDAVKASTTIYQGIEYQ